MPDEGAWTRLLTSAKVWASYYVGRGAILHVYPIGSRPDAWSSSRRASPRSRRSRASLSARARSRRPASRGFAAPDARRSGSSSFWIALLPTSNLLVPIGTVGAFRLLYLPSLAWGLLAGGLLHLAVSRVPPTSRRAAVAAAILVPAIGWSAVSLAEGRNWRNDASLNASDLERTRSPRAASSRRWRRPIPPIASVSCSRSSGSWRAHRAAPAEWRLTPRAGVHGARRVDSPPRRRGRR